MHAVDGGMNGSTVLFVCRANQGGTDYDVGHLDWTGCHTMTGRVMAVRKDNYQVIITILLDYYTVVYLCSFFRAIVSTGQPTAGFWKDVHCHQELICNNGLILVLIMYTQGIDYRFW